MDAQGALILMDGRRCRNDPVAAALHAGDPFALEAGAPGHADRAARDAARPGARDQALAGRRRRDGRGQPGQEAAERGAARAQNEDVAEGIGERG